MHSYNIVIFLYDIFFLYNVIREVFLLYTPSPFENTVSINVNTNVPIYKFLSSERCFVQRIQDLKRFD